MKTISKTLKFSANVNLKQITKTDYVSVLFKSQYLLLPPNTCLKKMETTIPIEIKVKLKKI